MYEIYWATYNSNLTGYVDLHTYQSSLISALHKAKEIGKQGGFSVGIRFMANGNWIYVRLPIRYSY